MGDRDDKILGALAALQIIATDTQGTVKGLEQKMTDVQITNAVQDNDIDTLKKDVADARSKVGAAFKKIEDHAAGHMAYYTGTIGIVVGILAVAHYMR